jgi:hypothetical protein
MPRREAFYQSDLQRLVQIEIRGLGGRLLCYVLLGEWPYWHTGYCHQCLKGQLCLCIRRGGLRMGDVLEMLGDMGESIAVRECVNDERDGGE